jgi:hypothetical protein
LLQREGPGLSIGRGAGELSDFKAVFDRAVKALVYAVNRIDSIVGAEFGMTKHFQLKFKFKAH